MIKEFIRLGKEKKVNKHFDQPKVLKNLFALWCAGDAVVSIVNADYSYNTKMNLQFNLFYPPTGRNAALINYVMIRVQQYSSIGKAYIISGGVNKRHISIVLEANATTYFTYDASMYGTN